MNCYTYEPEKIRERGKDRMRFELGDIMTGGGAETCALADEEYEAILAQYPENWRRAKLALIESIVRRFSYEVDTKVGPLSLSLSQRLEAWQQMAAELKRELARSGVPSANPAAVGSPPYFYAGMHDNPEAKSGKEGKGHVHA